MGLKRLVPLFVRYTLVGGALCTALLLGGAAAAFVATDGGGAVEPVAYVALVSTVVGFGVGSLSFATNNSGTDTIEAGVAGGFDVTDPSLFRASTSGLPRRYRLGALCLGVGLFSAVYLAAALSFA